MELMPGELWFEMWGAVVVVWVVVVVVAAAVAVVVVVVMVFGMKDGVSMLLIFNFLLVRSLDVAPNSKRSRSDANEGK